MNPMRVLSTHPPKLRTRAPLYLATRADALDGSGYGTPAHAHSSAGQNLHLDSGEDTVIAAGKGIMLAAKEAFQVFAAKSGMRLFAGKGNIEIQAHEGKINLVADQDVQIVSANQTLEVLAKESLRLAAGGVEVLLKDGKLILTMPGEMEVHTSGLKIMGGAQANAALPHLPMGDIKPGELFIQHLYHDDEGVQGASFEAILSDGSRRKGLTDAEGYARLPNVPPGPVKIQFDEDCRPFDRKDKTQNPRHGQSLDEVIERYCPGAEKPKSPE